MPDGDENADNDLEDHIDKMKNRRVKMQHSGNQ